MHRLRSRLVVGLTALAVFAFAGMALADEGDDTVLNYGYDDGNRFFYWNVTSLESSFIAGVADETPETTEEEQLEALLAACGLEGDDPEDPDTYSYSYDPATGLTTVTAENDAGGGDTEAEEIVCGAFNGGDVTGPAGQVNHGMFLKLFNEKFEGEGGRGCLVSQIARSGLGKGDQQVRAGDSTEPAEEETEIVEGTITFSTVTTDCQRGKDKGEEVERDEVEGPEAEESHGHGPPQHVLDKFGGQHPRDSRGKPSGTPGGRP